MTTLVVISTFSGVCLFFVGGALLGVLLFDLFDRRSAWKAYDAACERHAIDPSRENLIDVWRTRRALDLAETARFMLSSARAAVLRRRRGDGK